MFKRRTELRTSKTTWDVPEDQRIVLDLCSIVKELKIGNEERLEFHLKQCGYADNEVKRAVVLVPMVFTFDVFDKIGIKYSKAYLLLDGASHTEHFCKDEPIALAAMAAKENVQILLGKETFLMVASISSGMNALNNALASGNTIEDLVGSQVSPTVIPASRFARKLGR